MKFLRIHKRDDSTNMTVFIKMEDHKIIQVPTFSSSSFITTPFERFHEMHRAHAEHQRQQQQQQQQYSYRQQAENVFIFTDANGHQHRFYSSGGGYERLSTFERLVQFLQQYQIFILFLFFLSVSYLFVDFVGNLFPPEHQNVREAIRPKKQHQAASLGARTLSGISSEDDELSIFDPRDLEKTGIILIAANESAEIEFKRIRRMFSHDPITFLRASVYKSNNIYPAEDSTTPSATPTSTSKMSSAEDRTTTHATPTITPKILDSAFKENSSSARQGLPSLLSPNFESGKVSENCLEESKITHSPSSFSSPNTRSETENNEMSPEADEEKKCFVIFALMKRGARWMSFDMDSNSEFTTVESWILKIVSGDCKWQSSSPPEELKQLIFS